MKTTVIFPEYLVTYNQKHIYQFLTIKSQYKCLETLQCMFSDKVLLRSVQEGNAKMAHVHLLYEQLTQAYSAGVLHSPAEFSSNPNQTHLSSTGY